MAQPEHTLKLFLTSYAEMFNSGRIDFVGPSTKALSQIAELAEFISRNMGKDFTPEMQILYMEKYLHPAES